MLHKEKPLTINKAEIYYLNVMLLNTATTGKFNQLLFVV